jgi:hypothetical protein
MALKDGKEDFTIHKNIEAMVQPIRFDIFA